MVAEAWLKYHSEKPTTESHTPSSSSEAKFLQQNFPLLTRLEKFAHTFVVIVVSKQFAGAY